MGTHGHHRHKNYWDTLLLVFCGEVGGRSGVLFMHANARPDAMGLAWRRRSRVPGLAGHAGRHPVKDTRAACALVATQPRRHLPDVSGKMPES